MIVFWAVAPFTRSKEIRSLPNSKGAKTSEVPSPKAGVIVKLHGEEGGKIAVGDVLVEIDESAKTLNLRKGKKKTENKSDNQSDDDCHDGVCQIPTKKDAGAVVGQLPEYEDEVAQHHYFFLKSGESLKSLSELAQKLMAIDNDTFSHHVNEYKNDFADWIRDVFDDQELAHSLEGEMDQKKYVKIIRDRLKQLEKATQ